MRTAPLPAVPALPHRPALRPLSAASAAARAYVRRGARSRRAARARTAPRRGRAHPLYVQPGSRGPPLPARLRVAVHAGSTRHNAPQPSPAALPHGEPVRGAARMAGSCAGALTGRGAVNGGGLSCEL